MATSPNTSHLGYATTVHRAQGATADTSHLVTGSGMTREHLCVAPTRGRHANHAYVPVDITGPETETHQQHPDSDVTGRELLDRILATTCAEVSATEHLDALWSADGAVDWGHAEAAPVWEIRTPPTPTI